MSFKFWICIIVIIVLTTIIIYYQSSIGEEYQNQHIIPLNNNAKNYQDFKQTNFDLSGVELHFDSAVDLPHNKSCFLSRIGDTSVYRHDVLKGLNESKLFVHNSKTDTHTYLSNGEDPRVFI